MPFKAKVPFLLSLVLLVILLKETQGRCSSCPSNDCPQTELSQGKCFRARYYNTTHLVSFYTITYYEETSQVSYKTKCGLFNWRRCTRYRIIYHKRSKPVLKYIIVERVNLACDAYCCLEEEGRYEENCYCGDPGTPVNGRRSISGLTKGHTVAYTCNTGYELSGSDTRTCQFNGSWSGSSATCPRYCGDPGTPVNGRRSISGLTKGHTVAYTCNTGYELSGSDTRTCQSNGLWSGSSATCPPVDCGTPRYLSNGQRRYSSTTFGSTVTYTCNTGYRMTAGSSSRMCQSNGLWSGSHPTCTQLELFLYQTISFRKILNNILSNQLNIAYNKD